MMKTQSIVPTQISIFPLVRPMGNLKAYAKLIINDTLILKGIKVLKGKFGHFISFPDEKKSQFGKQFDLTDSEVSKHIKNSILKEYARVMTTAHI